MSGQAPEGNTPVDMPYNEIRSLESQIEHKFTLGIPMRRPLKGELAEESDDGMYFDT